MADNNFQLPIWTDAHPFELYDSGKRKHRNAAKNAGQFLKYQMTQYVRNTPDIYHTKRHLYAWIDQTRVSRWAPDTIRKYLKEVKDKLADENTSDDNDTDDDSNDNNSNDNESEEEDASNNEGCYMINSS